MLSDADRRKAPVSPLECLGHPAMGVAWLAKKLARFDKALKPGHIVLSGSFTRPVWAQKGDTLRADFGKLDAVSVQFI
jgi:2-oxo-hept-3-ene-1,7-dioate hydratase